MADFNNPLSNQGYLALLASIVENNQAALTLLEGVAPLDNLPVNAKQWNPDNARFETWDGTVWAELAALYEIKVRNTDQLNGQTEAFYRNAGNLNAGVLPAGQFNDTAHGVRGGGSLHALANGTTAGFMPPFEFNKLAGIEAGATADMTPAEILAALITVDGAGSGLDADLIDGKHAGELLWAANDLSDLNSVPNAQSNLGLGALATKDTTATADINNAAVTNLKLGALAVNDSKINKAIGSSGSQLIGTTSSWTPAAGFYNIVTENPPGGLFEIYISGAWNRKTESDGFVWCDGANMRFRNPDNTVTLNVAYQKLG